MGDRQLWRENASSWLLTDGFWVLTIQYTINRNRSHCIVLYWAVVCTKNILCYLLGTSITYTTVCLCLNYVTSDTSLSIYIFINHGSFTYALRTYSTLCLSLNCVTMLHVCVLKISFSVMPTYFMSTSRLSHLHLLQCALWLYLSCVLYVYVTHFSHLRHVYLIPLTWSGKS